MAGSVAVKPATGCQGARDGLQSQGTPSQAGPGFPDCRCSALRRTFYGVTALMSLAAGAVIVTGSPYLVMVMVASRLPSIEAAPLIWILAS